MARQYRTFGIGINLFEYPHRFHHNSECSGTIVGSTSSAVEGIEMGGALHIHRAFRIALISATVL